MGKAKNKKERRKTESQSKVETVADSPCVQQCFVPKGLPNLGNTCFFNSVTQCILQTHCLTKYVTEVGRITELVIPRDCVVVVNDVKVQVRAARIPLPEPSMTFVKTFASFMAEFRCGMSPHPRLIFDQIAKKVPRFRGWSQQDAHELLRYFLDGLRQDEIDRFKSGVDEYTKGIDCEKELTLQRKAIIKCAGIPLLDAAFGGTLLQTIQCSECGHISTTFEPFLDLSLPLVSTDCQRNNIVNKKSRKSDRRKRKKSRKNKSLTDDEKEETNDENGVEDGELDEDRVNGNLSISDVEDLCDDVNMMKISKFDECTQMLLDEQENSNSRGVLGAFKRFVSVDVLCEADAYECAKCCAAQNKNKKPHMRKTVKSFKRYMIFSPPAILTFHLKRFEQTHGPQRTTSRKIRGHIEFPTVLDIAPFCAKSEERVRPKQTKILYSLYGVVCHSGDLSGGHYVAYVRSRREHDQTNAFFDQAASFSDASRLGDLLLHVQMKKELNGSLASQPTPSEQDAEETLRQLETNSRWYYCSDSTVSLVPESKVLSCEAYLLFYERIF